MQEQTLLKARCAEILFIMKYHIQVHQILQQ